MSQSTNPSSIIDLLHQGNKTTCVLAQIIQKGLECGQLNLQDNRTLALLETVAQSPLHLYSRLISQENGAFSNAGIGCIVQSSNLCQHAGASSASIPCIGAETRAVLDMPLRQRLHGVAEGNNVNCSVHNDVQDNMFDASSCTNTTATMSTVTLPPSLANESGISCNQHESPLPTNKRLATSTVNQHSLVSNENNRSKRQREMYCSVLSTLSDISLYISSKRSRDQGAVLTNKLLHPTHSE